MDLAVTSMDDWKVVSVEGELDLATVGLLEQHLEEVLSGGARSVVVDLTGLTFMDSNGLRLLLEFRNRLPDGRLVVAAGNGPVRRLFELTGIEGTVSIFDSVEQAVGS